MIEQVLASMPRRELSVLTALTQNSAPTRQVGRTEAEVSEPIEAGVPGEPDLLVTVARELRTPVMTLAASSELLDQDFEALDAEQVRRVLATIRRDALWLQAQVENLVCAAAIRERQFEIRPRAIDLLEVLAEVRPAIEPLLAGKAQELRLPPSGTAGDVLADPRQIGQALVNLLSNASAFGRPNTPIEVTVEAEPGRALVSVADRGPGIPEGFGLELFEPTRRPSSAAGSGQRGVGLGLAVVKAIVEAHGGRVGAENRVGGGARFWFELPATREAGTPPLG